LPVLDAIFNQTYAPAEVIVADNGSTDSTIEALHELHVPELQIVKLEATGLPAKARNAGIEKATGNFIAFCDSDDIWIAEKLAIQVDALTESIKAVCSNAYITSAHGHTYFNSMPTALTTANLLTRNWVITSTLLVDKELFKKTGGFSATQRLRLVEDYATWLRISTFTNFAVIADPLIFYEDKSPSSHRLELETDGLLVHPVAWLDFLAWMRQRGHPLTFSENFINVVLPRTIAANAKMQKNG
jgi:glycosyltransferase involved in cell wall biosynthesis